MSEISLHETDVSIEKRYGMLRKSLAHYLLLQVSTFIEGAGVQAVGPAMEILTQKSAELKSRKVKEKALGDPTKAVEGLSQNLAESMGETFRSDYYVSGSEDSKTVTLRECGCIKSVTEVAEDYGLTGPHARSIFCGACMNGYGKAAAILNLGFKGKLSKEGCVMSFSTK